MADELRERAITAVQDLHDMNAKLYAAGRTTTRRRMAEELADAVLAALDLDDPAVLRQLLTRSDGSHRYLATGCLHGGDQAHGHCRNTTNVDGGEKRPGVCKWGPCECICECHSEAAEVAR